MADPSSLIGRLGKLDASQATAIRLRSLAMLVTGTLQTVGTV